MPRRLPWNVPQAQSSAPTLLPAKRERSSPGRSSPNEGDGSRCSRLATNRTANRSPSSSPPPPPLPKEDYMRYGLDADDAYIMVEDEFLSVARSFTAHLHHAEYKRLKALARSRKRVPEVGSGSGSDTPLPTLLKRKRAASANLARSRAALESIGAIKPAHSGGESASPPPAEYDPDDSGPDFTSRRSSPKADDPWLGTSLAPLMSPRTRRSEAHVIAPPALGRLTERGARSDTRAARGFAASIPMPRSGKDREPVLPMAPVRAGRDLYVSARVGWGECEDDSDDDLDLSSTTRSVRKREEIHEAKRRSEIPRLPSPPARDQELLRRERDVSKVQSRDEDRLGHKVRWKDEGGKGGKVLGKYEEPPEKNTALAAKRPVVRPWLKGHSRNGEGSSGGGRKAVNVNEIPTFLV